MAEIVDIAIVGGGPAGLTAALYGARGRANTVVYEAGLPGGQIITASWVENYPGFPDGVSGDALGDLFFKQAQNAGAQFRTLTPVESIRKDGCDFVLGLDGEKVTARALILATGAVPKRLGSPGEAKFAGRGVSWCATCDAPLYRDKVVAVVGGGDAASPRSSVSDQVRQASTSDPPAGRAKSYGLHPGAMLHQPADHHALVAGDR